MDTMEKNSGGNKDIYFRNTLTVDAYFINQHTQSLQVDGPPDDVLRSMQLNRWEMRGGICYGTEDFVGTFAQRLDPEGIVMQMEQR
jgi:hypothetical protein